MPSVVGDVGTVLSIDVGVDVSGAVSAKMIFSSPSGDVFSRTASTSGNAVQYTTTSLDFDESGVWTLQAFVDLGSWSGYSKPAEYVVYNRLLDVE
jgi:hypothetical protein